MSTRIMRQREWAYPPARVQREVRMATPVDSTDAPPVLFVPGFGHGAWIFAEHWLEYTAERGFPAYAMSLRGHGTSGNAPKTTFRAYVHDVTQVAASLPRQAVLVGHGAGALVVAQALARYPARAGVLVAPVFGGFRTGLSALVRNPIGTLPAVFGGPLRLSRRQMFGRGQGGETAERGLSSATIREYVSRLGRASARAQWQLLAHSVPERPVGDPPVLVVGSPDDRIVSDSALTNVARRYGTTPVLFPGTGHDPMLDAGWREPIDAILGWLEETTLTSPAVPS